ncbi:MAG: metal ABC transporter permease, partial [Oscillospiraceae bacterium]|nr:metal ABC transporter permease [Oscillospiraceae bacterium]
MYTLIEMLGYQFFQRALIAGALIALCTALLGTTLVLKNYSMIGDGLSHVGFGALAIASAFGIAPLPFALAGTVGAAFILLRVGENGVLRGDTAIAVLSASALAIGTAAASLSGENSDLNAYLFGSALALTSGDVWISIALGIVVTGLFMVFCNRIFAVTFDETFAQATGMNPKVYNSVTAILTAVTVTLGTRLVGALLISSLLIFPSLSAGRIFKSWRGVTISSAVLSVLCYVLGLCASALLATPVGASIVIVNLIVFAALSIVKRIR